MNKHKYIGDRAFYKMTMTVALPIMIQNFITNFVNMLDNLMVGSVGTEHMSGVSIVNQLVFVFNLAIFGAISGAGIFTAQYFGKKDDEGIRYTLRYKIGIAFLTGVCAIAIFLIFGDQLISLYLHDGQAGVDVNATLVYARQYLSILIIGLIPFAIAQTFAGTLRETGETFVPMVVGFIAVLINCVFNYLLIFGKAGFPVLGVKGAAIATVMSRYAECIIIIIYSFSKKKRFRYISGLFKSFSVPKELFADITRKGMPLMLNELFWSVGMSLLSVSYSLHGVEIVAAYSISSTVSNLFNIAFLSLGSSSGIIVGKLLGADEFDEAYDTARKLMAFSLMVSLVMGAAMILSSGAIPQLYNTDDSTKAFATYFIRCAAVFMPAVSIANSSYFIIRSGGKVIVTILFDSVYIFAISVPVAFSMYYLFHLPITVAYPIVIGIDILKATIGTILVKKKIWVNNIVSKQS